jgi:hypothetical protein
MNHRDIAVLMDGIAPVLRGYVEKAFEPIGARMLALEKRFNDLPAPRDPDPVMILRLVEETVAKIPPAQPGKDADPALVAELVDKAVAALEPAKDGAQGPAGRDGKDADPVEIANLLVDLMPVPAPGKDGAPGEPGKSVTLDDLVPLVEDMLAKMVAEIPAAKDGADGKDGAPGRDGRDGLPGVQGEKGLDGRNGIDGKDGLGIDDFDVKAIDDGRALEFSLKREGAEPVLKRVDLATVLDRGVWREQGYSKGDGVTWGGSFFIAQRATEAAEKPGNSDGWRLSVKKGRDGKDGVQGKQGERGPKGEPARNLV